MDSEDGVVIDVDVEQVDFGDESIREKWYLATQAQKVTGLNKAAFQRAITKLTDIYNIDISLLRRGSARATEYSHLCLQAVGLLDAKKFTKLRTLVSGSPVSVCSSAIVFAEKHTQIAATSAAATDNNLVAISSHISGLLCNYRALGRATGKQAVAEFGQGFTEEVEAGLERLKES